MIALPGRRPSNRERSLPTRSSLVDVDSLARLPPPCCKTDRCAPYRTPVLERTIENGFRPPYASSSIAPTLERAQVLTAIRSSQYLFRAGGYFEQMMIMLTTYVLRMEYHASVGEALTISGFLSMARDFPVSEVDIVAVVDDDEFFRLSVCMLIESLGVEVRSYASGREFLESSNGLESGCLITDVRMPGFSGIELQKKMIERGIQMPIIFITGHGDIPMAVEAMRQGALDFLLKPFNQQALLDRVQQGLDLNRRRHKETAWRREIEARIAKLSQRELEVLRLLVAGNMSKVVAVELGISPRTVECHRASIMEKMHAGSIAELVQLMTIAHGRIPE
jgi:two-component system, LuxR family, response regulator FixJ